MANFAIHDGATVVNVIVADSVEIAEQITGLQAIETTGQPWTNWIYKDGEWVDPFAPVEPVQTIEDEEPAAITPETPAE
jgi:hypothetical protein